MKEGDEGLIARCLEGAWAAEGEKDGPRPYQAFRSHPKMTGADSRDIYKILTVCLIEIFLEKMGGRASQPVTHT